MRLRFVRFRRAPDFKFIKVIKPEKKFSRKRNEFNELKWKAKRGY